MNEVYDGIIKYIKLHGYITVDYYMQLIAEYYYGNLKTFGKQNDFITAPEISSIFGMTIGKWLINSHFKLNSPQEFCIIELGSGSGKMLHDILTYLGDEFLSKHKITIHIIEQSLSLQNLQLKTLESFKNITITWHRDLKNLPNLPTIFLANEFFDALPIKQYIKQKDNWFEVIIKLNTTSNKLYFTKTDIHSDINNLLKIKYPLAISNAIAEQSLEALKIFNILCNHLNLNNGAILAIDYGYEYNPKRRVFFNSTLQTVKAHKFCNLFEDIGNADITAHVDFYELINIAKLAKCEVSTSVTQTKFLLNSGIANIVQQNLVNLSNEEQSKLNFALNRLLSPEEMGSVFRALEIYSIVIVI